MCFLNDKHSKEKMFAIIRQGNKQYRVSEGDTLRIDLMNAENGSSFETDQVLAVGGEGEMKIGRPLVDGAKVQGTVMERVKGEKLIIFRRKRRKTQRRKVGHRQQHSLVKIEKITA
jgi:large subunit ribosomal protein L21